MHYAPAVNAPGTTNSHPPDAAGIEDARFVSVRRILRLAGPLILSQMGVMLMQIVDGVFLAHYSEAAIAAVGPAGMSFWLVCGLFMGVAGYSNTFVAQYMGARQPHRAGPAVWQALYVAAGAGLLLALGGFGATALFRLVGHAADVQVEQAAYFRILSWGGASFLLSAALSGFFAGRHDNRTLMAAHLAGGAANAVLDALLIFGLLGFPRMGIAGAALATVAGHALQVGILLALFLSRRHRRAHETWGGRRFRPALAWRLVRYGLPNGLRFVVEIGAWTVFLVVVGRVDPAGLAASNIVWRVNGMAFFPVIGLSIAVSMLVGQAQGAKRPDLSRRATHRGLLIGQVWMTSAAALMLLAPGILLRLFFSEIDAPRQAELHAQSVMLLRYVAVYSLADNVNIMIMAMLAGAGDTRWMVRTSGVLHAAFLAALLAAARGGARLRGLWLTATVFVLVSALVWALRFLSRAWESKQVIEPAPTPDVVNPAFPEPV